MDEGPFRAQRPTDRDAANRPEPIVPPEEPKPVKEEPKHVQHRSAPAVPNHYANDEKSWKRFLVPIIGIIVVLVLVVAGWLFFANKGNTDAAIDSSKYQAVFFTNGQVYFGKLQAFNSEYMKLTNVFYLQQKSTDATTDSKNPQETSTDSNNVLIKLGDEIHGPEDEMIVAKNQVLFYENLKSDGKVSSTINDYSKSHK